MSTIRVGDVQNVAGTGVALQSKAPLLSALRITSSHTITSSVWTKMQFNSILADHTAAWDAANFRFVPQVQGWYQATVVVDASSSVSSTGIGVGIYKNGASHKLGSTNNQPGGRCTVTGLVWLNGSTDYVEGFAIISASTPAVSVGSYMDINLVKAGPQ